MSEENKHQYPVLESIILFSCICIWRPIYIARKNFDISWFSQLRQTIIEYKQWILIVFVVNLIIIFLTSIHSKKMRILNLFTKRWKPLIYICSLIYPFLSDFNERLWKISETNSTIFYAIFLPIFIMFFIMSILDITSDRKTLIKELKDTLWIKSKTSNKTNSLIIWSSIANSLSIYAFLFWVLAWRMCLINKVYSSYNNFMLYPCAFFLFSLGISISLSQIVKVITHTNTSKQSDAIIHTVKSKKRTATTKKSK